MLPVTARLPSNTSTWYLKLCVGSVGAVLSLLLQPGSLQKDQNITLKRGSGEERKGGGRGIVGS
jgi:hypothetical protein